jgi:VWFA-related protein
MRIMKHFAAVPIIGLLVGIFVLTAIAQEPPFSINLDTNLVNLLCTVTDKKGRLITNLNKGDFIVEEDGKPQEILKFSKENELPLTLALLMDTSGSVSEVLPEEKETAIAFINTILTRKDLAMVIKFDHFAKVIQDFTEDKSRMEDAIESVRKTGDGTALFDAIVLASRDHLAMEAGRKAMILISDGQDSGSSHSQRNALFAAHEADAVIYSISNVLDRNPNGYGNPGVLKALSLDTGGAAYFIHRTSDFKDIFDQIANELRSQYSLAYKSTNTKRDGKFRAVKITLRDSSLTGRTRRGYYGPTD